MSYHPNRVAFEGVLTLVDVASDLPPLGAKLHRKRCSHWRDRDCTCDAPEHRVILTRVAAESALPSLLGMAVDYKAGWCGHDARQKCGVIETAELVGVEVHVGGYLFARDFPEVVETVRSGGTRRGALGMSYELADAHVADMNQEIWTLTQVIFTGAAILLRNRAAYRRTSFRLVAPGLALAAAAERPGVAGLVMQFKEADVEEEDGEA